MAERGGQELPGIEPDATQPAPGILPVPDEGSDKENMENQRDTLVERMESEFGLLDKLRKSLTHIQIAEIKSKATTFEKNKRLLELVFENNKHQDLIRALIDTRQTHLVNWVRGNGVYSIEFALDWPLREKEIESLEDNQENWTDLLDPCELLTLLHSKRVLNGRQRDFIQSKRTTYEKNEDILTILRRCSLASYAIVISCLHASNQRHIALMLEGSGAILQAHANLEADQLDETEMKIVRDFTSALLQTAEDRTGLLLQEVQMRVIAVRKGSSIVLYIYCETMAELTYLCEVIDDKKLKDELENIFNTLLHDMSTKVIDLYIVETEIDKAKKFFEREASRGKQFDEEISRLQEQIRHEPMQERTPGEASSDDEEEKSLLPEQKWQQRAVSDEQISANLLAEQKGVAAAEGGGDGNDDEESDDDFDDDDDDDYEGDATDIEKQKHRMAEGFEDVETAMGKLQLSELTRMDVIAAIMRNTTDYLMEHMRTEGLIDKLHAAECLTDDDTRYIKTLSIRSERNDEILNVIDNEKKYNDLINCLRQTKQHLATDIVEKGGVVLKMKVTLKKVTIPDVEKHLVKMIGSLHDKAVPKREEVLQFLSQLRRGSIEILDAQPEGRAVILWVWCRSEKALSNVRAWYKSKNLNKILSAFFRLLTSHQMQLPEVIRTNIEDIDMEYSAWPPKLDILHQLPVAEGVVCGVTTLPGKIFVLCQKPIEVLVFESQEYSKPSKRIPVIEILNPVDIVACHQAACLYITDITSLSIWKVTTDDDKVTQWLQNVGHPCTLSLTTNGEVVMVRRGQPSTLEVYSSDGQKLHDIKLPPKITLPNHAVGTSAGTFFVSYGDEKNFSGIFEIDKGGNTISNLDFGYGPIAEVSDEVNSILDKLYKEIPIYFVYPRYLALGKKDQLYAADFENGGLMVFDSQLCLEQVIGKEDVKETLRLHCGDEDNQLVIVHGEKRLLSIYKLSFEVAE